MSTNRKVSERMVYRVPDVRDEKLKGLNCSEGQHSPSICNNVYFANRLRRASESTKLYFGARMRTVEAFV